MGSARRTMAGDQKPKRDLLVIVLQKNVHTTTKISYRVGIIEVLESRLGHDGIFAGLSESLFRDVMCY